MLKVSLTKVWVKMSPDLQTSRLTNYNLCSLQSMDVTALLFPIIGHTFKQYHVILPTCFGCIHTCRHLPAFFNCQCFSALVPYN